MNEFERTVVNEPSVFEPLKFYYSLRWISKAVYINSVTNMYKIVFFSFDFRVIPNLEIGYLNKTTERMILL